MAWKSNHPYLVPMTLEDMAAMVKANDPITRTNLACPDCGEGRMVLDLEPAPARPSNRNHPALDTSEPILTPVLVCTTCGYATSANHVIYGPRDTTGSRG